MSDPLNLFYTALRERIANVWPEVLPNGIFEADHAETIPWERLTTPYAVIAIDTLPKAEGWGLGNQVYNPDVQIFRVDEVKGPLSSLRTELQALDDELLTTPLSVGQVLKVSELTWSSRLAPNQIFISKGMTHRAGRLTANCLLGRVLNTGT